MHTFSRLLGSVAVLAFTMLADAQQPGGGPGQIGQGGFNNGGVGMSPVDRLMSMDTNADGYLTVDEVTDMRMRSILNRSDANQDGMISRAELTMMAGGQQAGVGNRGGGQGLAGGQGFGVGQGFGGDQPAVGGLPAGGMPGGLGGLGPQPVGQILPEFMHDQLGLTAEQRTAIAKLQAGVDAQLARILTAEQQQMLQQGADGPGGPQDVGRNRRRGQAHGLDQGQVRGRGQDQGVDQGQAAGRDQARDQNQDRGERSPKRPPADR